MKIVELLKKYDFHDSLVEGIFSSEGNIQLQMDFCNWKQSRYLEGDEETKEITLIFENVYYSEIPKIEFNSDEVIEVKKMKSEDGKSGLAFILFNDVESTTYSIVIFAEEVFIKNGADNTEETQG